MRRIAESISINVISATACVFVPGMLHTATPCRFAASRSIVFTPTPIFWISFSFGAPPVVNDPEMTAIVKKAAGEVVGDRVTDGPLLTVSEDYAEYLERVPGCFYFVGSSNAERGLTWGHHHPRFDVDEDALTIGVETMTRTVLHYFAS